MKKIEKAESANDAVIEYSRTQQASEGNSLTNTEDIGDVSYYCGLTPEEYYEREMLLEKQRIRTQWFSQEQFERLKGLSTRMFSNAGLPTKKAPLNNK